jgi:Ca-activated chloride channel homolog
MRRRGTLPILVLALGAVLAGLVSRAQVRPARPPVPSPIPSATPTPRTDVAPLRPVLLAQVTPDRPSQPLGLSRMAVEVTITGFLARTRTTLTFRNDTSRVLEGELVFPLPEGATISGYALDIGGQLVDGVVVEREAARVAFESEVRRGVDPGLVEWVRGNNFRTRVYPIPAHGTRTARIEYVSDLATEGHGATLDALYVLPLKQTEPLDEFELKVDVSKGATQPEVRTSGLANFHFSAFEDRYVAHTRLTTVHLGEDLRVALPHVPRENAVVELGDDGSAYFAIHDFPGLPAVPSSARPRRVGLLWDASLSHGRADKRRELELVRRWISGLGEVEVVLTAFRNVPEPARRFVVHAGDASALLHALDELPYDGGTDLSRLVPESDVAYHVLVSDGLATLGSGEPRTDHGPIYALSADVQADHGRLRHLASSSGGAYFNLTSMSDEAVLAALGAPAWTATAEHDPGIALAEVLPYGAQPVQSERVTLVGRLVAPEARLRLRYASPGREAREHTYVLSRAAAGHSGLVPRFWAQHKLAELQLAPERNRAELLALGRKFGLVTPGTSLLVLETLDQYVRHGVEPPASLPALRDEYRRRVDAQAQEQNVKQRDKLERVVALWEERVRWWDMEFRPLPNVTGQAGPRERRTREADDYAAQGVVSESVAAGRTDAPLATAPPPPPPGAAPAARPEPARALRALGYADAGGNTAVEAKKEAGASATSQAATIAVKPWDPETPYLSAMKAVGAQRAYNVYLSQRDQHGASPAFYLDCADHLLRAGQHELGVRVLTSLLDLKLDDARLLRVAAHRLQQAAELDLAIELFEHVLRERPEEPQSARDLALAFAARGDARDATGSAASPAAEDYLRALELLDGVVRHDWDARFPEIETIALMDANRILALFEREKLPGAERIRIDPRLRRLLDVDVRVVLTWDSDQSDMDLWVTEPSGEKCLYSHNRTATGGRLSHDFTGGYGPEEYVLRRGPSGQYLVQANFYGTRAQSLTGPTTVQATVITNFGRPDEKREALTLRLSGAKDVVEIGRVTLVGTAKVTP